MKKLVFGLIATVMFGLVGNAQSTFETAQYRGVMASFVEAARANEYEKGTSQDEFVKNVFGDSKPSDEEMDFIVTVYNYLEKGTTGTEILCSYKGTEVKALVEKVSRGEKVFGFTSETARKELKPCRGQGFWHWLGCSLENVVTILEQVAEVVAAWCSVFPC